MAKETKAQKEAIGRVMHEGSVKNLGQVAFRSRVDQPG